MQLEIPLFPNFHASLLMRDEEWKREERVIHHSTHSWEHFPFMTQKPDNKNPQDRKSALEDCKIAYSKSIEGMEERRTLFARKWTHKEPPRGKTKGRMLPQEPVQKPQEQPQEQSQEHQQEHPRVG